MLVRNLQLQKKKKKKPQKIVTLKEIDDIQSS